MPLRTGSVITASGPRRMVAVIFSGGGITIKAAELDAVGAWGSASAGVGTLDDRTKERDADLPLRIKAPLLAAVAAVGVGALYGTSLPWPTWTLAWAFAFVIINALNSGAKVFMADFEDSNSPTWTNTIEGQINHKKTSTSWRIPFITLTKKVPYSHTENAP